jgi:hypothetical protein
MPAPEESGIHRGVVVPSTALVASVARHGPAHPSGGQDIHLVQPGIQVPAPECMDLGSCRVEARRNRLR